MKKLLAMFLAVLMLLSTATTAVWADNEDDGDLVVDTPLDVLPGLDFDSLGELLEYIDELDEDYVSHADEWGFGDGVLEYLFYEMDGVYLPDGVELNEVSIYVDPDYVSVTFCRNDQWLELRYYDAGSNDESEILNYIPQAEARQAFKTLDDETKAYYQYQSNRWWFYFEMDGIWFSMTNWSSTSDYELSLEYSSATYHTFGEAYNLAAESSDGKVKLSWDKIVDDSTYTVYWKRSGSDEWNIAGTTTKQKVSITGLRSGVSYDFRIKATGVESEEVTIVAE